MRFFSLPYYLSCCSFRYYCLSAACALFKYVEARLNTHFAAGSLRIKYAAVDGTMLIDPDTARNLELVGNMTHRKSNHSLFGFATLSCLYDLPLLYSYIAFWRIQGPQSHFYAHGFQTSTCQHPVPYYPWVSTPSPLPYLISTVVHSAIDARLDVVDGKFKHPLDLVSYVSSQSL